MMIELIFFNHKHVNFIYSQQHLVVTIRLSFIQKHCSVPKYTDPNFKKRKGEKISVPILHWRAERERIMPERRKTEKVRRRN